MCYSHCFAPTHSTINSLHCIAGGNLATWTIPFRIILCASSEGRQPSNPYILFLKSSRSTWPRSVSLTFFHFLLRNCFAPTIHFEIYLETWKEFFQELQFSSMRSNLWMNRLPKPMFIESLILALLYFCFNEFYLKWMKSCFGIQIKPSLFFPLFSLFFNFNGNLFSLLALF